MFLVMQRHSGVLNKRIIAIVSGAMEMPIGLITRTIIETTVNVSVIEFEPIKNFDVIVEVFTVHNQYVFLIGDV